METTSRTVAASLTQNLSLAVPPIAVAICDEVPDGVPLYEGVVAAGCRFWQEAATRALGAFHARRRADVEAGERPSLEQSLARIQ